MKISTLGYSIKQGFSNIGRNKLFSLASIVTMSACIFVFGLFFSIVMNFHNIVLTAEEGVAITVFFHEDTTEEQKKAIGEKLRSRKEVSEVKYVTAEEAWEHYKQEYLGDKSEELAEGFKDNPLANQDNFEIYMKHVEGQKSLVKYAEGLPGVRKVNRSEVVAKTLGKVNKLIIYASAVVIMVLLIVSIFLISNTITMGITVRREEIAIMKYIGAKDFFVRAPFVVEGMLLGLIGTVIPLVALYFLYNKAVVYVLTKFAVLNSILDFLSVNAVYHYLVPISLVLGMGIGLIGSAVTIRKHLKV